MANTTISKITISKDNANLLVKSVRDGLALVNKGYLAIAPDVQRLYDTHAFEVLGYKNFDELCTNEFGMSHGTTVGIRKVFALYGTKSSKDGSYSIPEKYQAFGYTKLLLFATDKDKFKEANINPIEEFNPEMTIGEMKAKLAATLADKAKEQEENAIETTATEDESIIDNSETTETIATEDESIIDNSETTATEKNEKMSTVEYIDAMLVDTRFLHDSMKDYIKPEKEVMFEAIESYLKELKKIAKDHDKKSNK